VQEERMAFPQNPSLSENPCFYCKLEIYNLVLVYNKHTPFPQNFTPKTKMLKIKLSFLSILSILSI
jgi:hypothetical protein